MECIIDSLIGVLERITAQNPREIGIDEKQYSMKIHRKQHSFFDILEILEGNTRRKIKIEVAEMCLSVEDKCFNLSEKWNQGENIVGTMIAKDQFTYNR